MPQPPSALSNDDLTEINAVRQAQGRGTLTRREAQAAYDGRESISSGPADSLEWYKWVPVTVVTEPEHEAPTPVARVPKALEPVAEALATTMAKPVKRKK